MVSLTTATESGDRPLASTVMPIDHFTTFCISVGTVAVCVYGAEPGNYECTAYYTDNKIYIKSKSSFDMSYLFAF